MKHYIALTVIALTLGCNTKTKSSHVDSARNPNGRSLGAETENSAGAHVDTVDTVENSNDSGTPSDGAQAFVTNPTPTPLSTATPLVPGANDNLPTMSVHACGSQVNADVNFSLSPLPDKVQIFRSVNDGPFSLALEFEGSLQNNGTVPSFVQTFGNDLGSKIVSAEGGSAGAPLTMHTLIAADPGTFIAYYALVVKEGTGAFSHKSATVTYAAPLNGGPACIYVLAPTPTPVIGSEIPNPPSITAQLTGGSQVRVDVFFTGNPDRIQIYKKINGGTPELALEASTVGYPGTMFTTLPAPSGTTVSFYALAGKDGLAGGFSNASNVVSIPIP